MKFWKKQIFSLLAALAVLLTLVPQRAEAASCGLSGAGQRARGQYRHCDVQHQRRRYSRLEADLSYDTASSVWRDQSPSSAAAGRSR